MQKNQLTRRTTLANEPMKNFTYEGSGEIRNTLKAQYPQILSEPIIENTENEDGTDLSDSFKSDSGSSSNYDGSAGPKKGPVGIEITEIEEQKLPADDHGLLFDEELTPANAQIVMRKLHLEIAKIK